MRLRRQGARGSGLGDRVRVRSSRVEVVRRGVWAVRRTSPQTTQIPLDRTKTRTRRVAWTETMGERATGDQKRTAWTLAQKREVCEYARDNPGKSHSDIARDLSSRWGVPTHAPLSRPVVAKTLRDRDAWLVLDNKARPEIKRRRAPAYEEMERALDEWYAATRPYPSDARVMERALEIASEVGGETGEKFRASRSWLARWKARRAAREPRESPCDDRAKGTAPVGVDEALRALDVLRRHVCENSDGHALRRRADDRWLDDLAARVELAAALRDARVEAIEGLAATEQERHHPDLAREIVAGP